MTLELNPRYANYCRAHGRTPDEQMAHDEQEWPGGKMCGFILWHRDRLREAFRDLPAAFLKRSGEPPAIIDHPAYDAWLDRRVDAWRIRMGAVDPQMKIAS